MRLDKKIGAILIVGPTGSGKTPLGEFFEYKGLWGKKCFHFDFGRILKRIVEEGKMFKNSLMDGDINYLKRILHSGALLDNDHFRIAEKILRTFISTCGINNNEDYIVLNGLPRHIGQAKNMESIVEIKLSVELLCMPEVAFERIRTNSGGDRKERTDDGIELIRKKFDIFRRQTLPLIEYYKEKGKRIETINVEVSTTPEEIWQTLEERKEDIHLEKIPTIRKLKGGF